MKILLFTLALAATIAAGFWFGRTTAPARRVSDESLRKISGSARPDASLADASNQSLTIERLIERLELECKRGVWRQTREWATLLGGLSASDLAHLISGARHLVLDPVQEELRRTLLALWSELDPAGALAFAEKLPPSRLRESSILAALKGWLRTHPLEAVAWIRKLPAGAVKNDAILLALPILSSQNPRAALELVVQLPPNQRSEA